MTLNVYYVRADDENGEDQGLLVRAAKVEDVVPHWQKYFDLEDSAKPKFVGQLPGVTATGEPGPINWAHIAAPV